MSVQCHHCGFPIVLLATGYYFHRQTGRIGCGEFGKGDQTMATPEGLTPEGLAARERINARWLEMDPLHYFMYDPEKIERWL